MTQTDRVIEWIRAHPGCTTMDLTLALRPFVANPRARISDARERGVVIECRRVDGVNRYFVAEPRPSVLRGEQAEMAL